MSWQAWRSDDVWRGKGSHRDRPYGGKGYSSAGYGSGGGYGSGYGAAETYATDGAGRPWGDAAHSKGHVKGSGKLTDRITIAEALGRIRAVVDEQRQVQQMASIFGQAPPRQWAPTADPPQAWPQRPAALHLLGAPTAGPQWPPSHACQPVEPVSQVARVLLQVGSAASSIATQTLAGVADRMISAASRSLALDPQPLVQLLRPAPPAEPAPERDAPQSTETLTSRLVAADRAGQAAERNT